MIKRSKSFKEAVSKVLDENSTKKKTNDELIEELYGNTSSGGAGSLTIGTQQNGGFSRGRMPPYSSYSDPEAAGQGGIDMRDNQPDSDVTKPNTLPFPLETTNDHLGYALGVMANVYEQIDIATNNPSLTEEKNKLIKNLGNKVKTIMGHIKKITLEIADLDLD